MTKNPGNKKHRIGVSKNKVMYCSRPRRAIKLGFTSSSCALESAASICPAMFIVKQNELGLKGMTQVAFTTKECSEGVKLLQGYVWDAQYFLFF